MYSIFVPSPQNVLAKKRPNLTSFSVQPQKRGFAEILSSSPKCNQAKSHEIFSKSTFSSYQIHTMYVMNKYILYPNVN